MPSAWVTHVRKYAADHNLSYMCAATKPECRASYQRPPKAPRAARGAPRRRAAPRRRSPSPMSPESPRGEFFPVIDFNGREAFYRSSLY